MTWRGVTKEFNMPRYEVSTEILDNEWEQTDISEELVPEGWHKVRIADFQVRKSQAGNLNILWEFRILDGGYEGFPVWDNTSLKQSAIWKLLSLGTAVNYAFVKGIPLSSQLKGVLDRELAIEITHEEWQGRPRARVNRYAASIAAEGNGSVATLPDSNGDNDSIPF
jgi:hypothetical protein